MPIPVRVKIHRCKMQAVRRTQLLLKNTLKYLQKTAVGRNLLRPFSCLASFVVHPKSKGICLKVLLLTACVWSFNLLWYSLEPPQRVDIVLTADDQVIKAIYKCAYENQDGSVDIVFNVPKRQRKQIKANITLLQEAKKTMGALASVQSSNRKPKLNVSQAAMLHRAPHEVKTIYPLDFGLTYIYNCPHLCPIGQQVDYLVMVHSATSHFVRRRFIRETFGGRAIFSNIVQRVVFLLGTTADPKITTAIGEEAVVFGDIVQGSFVDAYHNLTFKGVMGYRWISEHCPQAKIIVKIDDDVFFNPFMLVTDILSTHARNKTKHLLCHVRKSGTSPIVRGKGRWKVKDDEFKGQKFFPFDYCNGYFVIITSDLIRPMLSAAMFTPFFWIDDVYLFGILPATVGGAKFVDLSRHMTLSFQTGKMCYTIKGSNCTLLVVSQFIEKEADTLWYSLLTNTTKATKDKLKLFGRS